MDISRRRFVFSSLGAGVTVAALSSFPFRFARASLAEHVAGSMHATEAFDPSPIRTLEEDDFASIEFNGDAPERAHELLWDIENYVRSQGGWPVASEEVEVVIVGGGMSGLAAAYHLRDRHPLVLELDNSFGGNSKGERVGRSVYAIGAAYIEQPLEGSEDEALLSELGLFDHARAQAGVDAHVFYKNNFAQGFWQGATDPAAENQFTSVYETLVNIAPSVRAASPTDEGALELDRISFSEWLRATFGDLHPHLLEYFQLCAWSSFAASIEEISAYQMLDYVAGETGNLLAFPGGNAAITQRLYEALQGVLPEGHLRSSAVVIDVRIESSLVLVTYVEPDGSLKTIQAKACVFASPKYVAKRVIRGLPTEQTEAMSSLRYRGYVVANVFLNKAVESPTFDLYSLIGAAPLAPTAGRPHNRPFTDICFGSWAQNDDVDQSVLTVYKAFAFDGDRQFLFNPAAHDRYRKQIFEGLKPLLTSLGMGLEDVLGLRMTRWGHSMPVAETDFIASGLAELSHQPFGERIFFANQDNWASPSFESCSLEARKAAAQVRDLVQLLDK